MEIYALEVLDLQILFEHGKKEYQRFIYMDKDMMKEDKKAYEILFLKGMWTYTYNGRTEMLPYIVETRTDGERGYKISSEHYPSVFNLENFDILRIVFIEVQEEPFWKRELISTAVSEGKLDHIDLVDLL